MDELAGVRAKLDRASSQLEALEREIRTFCKCRPYRIEGKFEAQRSGYIFRLYIIKRPPISWGVLSGEIVHNARSALDNLVWQLVLLNRRNPGRHNSFPIWDSGTSEEFLRATVESRRGRKDPGKLYGVSRDGCAIIERAQPYNGGLCERLTALDSLWNIDKHKFLMPTFVSITDPELIGPVFHANEDAEIVGEAKYADVGWQKDGAELVFIPLAVTGPNPKVDMEGDLPIDITFGNGGDMIDVLTGAIFFIRVEVLAPIEELFGT